MKLANYDYVKKYFFESATLKKKYDEKKVKEAFDLVDSIMKDFKVSNKRHLLEVLNLPTYLRTSVMTIYLESGYKEDNYKDLDKKVKEYLTDKYGYCVKSFNLKIIEAYKVGGEPYPSEVIIDNIDWDLGD